MSTIVKIGGGFDTSEVTATANDILQNKSIVDPNGDLINGAIVNHGTVTVNAPYTNSGYYASLKVNTTGNATAAQVLNTVTFMNASGAQTGTMVNHGTCSTSVAVDGTFTGSGYYSSLKITGPTLSGNATAAEVREGYTFYNTSGTLQYGTLADKTFKGTVAVGGTCSTTTAGYYTSISVTGPTLSGNAVAAEVLKGQTFYSNTGTKITGTMTNKGDVTCSAGKYTGTAGYYNSITITMPTMSGTATSARVLNGFTFYNKSATTVYTGAKHIWVCSGTVINGSWQHKNLGWTPTYYGAAVACSTTSDNRTKCYVSGTIIYWCLNGSGSLSGYVVAGD